ncbi:RNA polymerase factor sigma-54 [Melaminivora sp.]|uniref:RNA polymerase factor sigma-54 n=1 Tax=Melaminivora sp. TaxID=1933032 RepID=UPI0028AB5A54|nr:RNA polymerase factor sigma-54 [Melaminivora sp.]
MSRPTLALRVSQHLTLTPQLQQSIRLLQLSTLELAQEVGQMLADNPFLEQEEGAEEAIEKIAEGQEMARVSGPSDPQEAAADVAAAEAREPADEPGLPDAPEQFEWQGEDSAPGDGESDSEPGGGLSASGPAGSGDGEADAIDLAGHHETLAEHLARQALALRLAPEERAALDFLIGSLDDDGYLDDSLEALAAGLLGEGEPDPELAEALGHRLALALALLQSLEPAGVGARGLAECLALQLRALAQAGTHDAALLQAAQALCAQPLELLARRDVRRLSQACGVSEEGARAALAFIARLEPRPGRRFADVQRQIIVPDVVVRRTGPGGQAGFAVQLNPDVLPRLRVHEQYAGALRAHRGSEGHAALQQRLQEARWFIKNVQQRFDTILRVSEAIVQRQKSFFVHGELAMRPLVLRDIADELGLHESTISRVTTAKYMATPQGTFELKYFFGSGLGTETGGNASSTAVRALIRQFIAAESPARPLSDSRIAELLKEQGIECARRTVAKYREALKIAPASLRKTL